MRLKDHCDITAFLNAVKRCRSKVYIATNEGDRLDLKSTLSSYVFAVISENEKLITSSTVECSREDAALLQEFLVQN